MVDGFPVSAETTHQPQGGRRRRSTTPDIQRPASPPARKLVLGHLYVFAGELVWVTAPAEGRIRSAMVDLAGVRLVDGELGWQSLQVRSQLR
jgi:hypothetical protein